MKKQYVCLSIDMCGLPRKYNFSHLKKKQKDFCKHIYTASTQCSCPMLLDIDIVRYCSAYYISVFAVPPSEMSIFLHGERRKVGNNTMVRGLKEGQEFQATCTVFTGQL